MAQYEHLGNLRSDRDALGGAYAWYTVGVLIVAYTLSFMDRQVLTLMVGPIRESLKISDTELSLLHGFAFALFYTFLGIPIGRLVDQHRRSTIVAAGVALWSLMTMGCGMARNFLEMFLLRVGVGVGEAALSPAAYSLIGDRFPPQQRAQALSFYLTAAHIGSGLALMIGGVLVSLMPPVNFPGLGLLQPWQAVFVLLGLPGLLLALWTLSLREPQRSNVAEGASPSFKEAFAYIRRHWRAYLLFILGFALSGLIWNGALAWLPSLFMRSFSWTPAEVGLRYGAVVMLSGTLGAVVGGYWAARLRRSGRADAELTLGLASLGLAAPVGVFATLVPNEWLALTGAAIFLFCCALPYGGAAAALQLITPNQFRGQITAVYLFAVSLMGMGTGPTAVALFTDLVFQDEGAVGRSLAVTICIGSVLAATTLWLARKPYREVLKIVDF